MRGALLRLLGLGALAAVSLAACGDEADPTRVQATGGDAGAQSTGSFPAGGGAGEGGASGSAGEPGVLVVGYVPYFGAGTRLKPIVYSSEGIDRFSGQWLDTELGVPCVFEPSTPDGVCMPQGDAEVADLYLDPACTIKAAFASSSTCPDALDPLIALGPPETECDSRQPYAIVGPKLDKPVRLYQATSTDACEVFADVTGESPFDYYPTERLERSLLVTSERELRDHATDLQVSVRAGADGSWVVDGFYNAEREETCAPPTADLVPDDRCLPPRAGNGERRFLDASCEQEALNEPGGISCGAAAPHALFVETSVIDSCPRSTTYDLLALGEPVDGAGYSLSADETCTVSGLEPGTLLPVLEPIDLESLPLLERLQVGAGRLRLPFFGVRGQPFWQNGLFVDGSGGEPCSAMRFSDGELRCVPPSWLRGSLSPTEVFYVSSDCSGEPLMIWTVGSCLADAVPRGILVPEPSCAGTIEQVREAVPFEGATLYSHPGASCNEVSVSSLEGLRVYALGEVLDPAQEFPLLEYAVRE